MLQVSDGVLAAFAQESRPGADAELLQWLCGKAPELDRRADLASHVRALVDWTQSRGITAMQDVYLIAEMNVLRGIDLSADRDFDVLCGQTAAARPGFMLDWIRAKPPAFWRAHDGLR